MTATREIPQSEADLQIKTDNFDCTEIGKAFKALNNCKAPGFDYKVTAETIKYNGMN